MSKPEADGGVAIESTPLLADEYRSVEANKLWQNDTGEQHNPDLGELLRYSIAQRELMYRLYWMLREGGYASDEYAEIMESIARKDFCRPNHAQADRPAKAGERGEI